MFYVFFYDQKKNWGEKNSFQPFQMTFDLTKHNKNLESRF